MKNRTIKIKAEYSVVHERFTQPLKSRYPLNAQAPQKHFQQLLNDPLIERMDARLIPGDTAEQNTLEIEVTRAHLPALTGY